MGYINDLGKEIWSMIDEGEDEGLVKFVQGKVWESYKNGKRDAKKEIEESKYEKGKDKKADD